MRVQFLWTNFDCPLGHSVGVAYLSGALRAAGHDTSIIHISDWLDYPFEVPRVVSDARNYGPDLIAASCGSNHYREMSVLLEALKKELDVPVILGGVHATLNAASVMKNAPFIDFVGLGEGDDSLPELAAALEAGRDTTNIPNIWARVDGQIKANGVRPPKDLEKIPWMDLQEWPQFQRIVDSRRGWVNVYMNRGCPYRCSYCHNNGAVKVWQEGLQAPSTSNEDLGYLRLRGIDGMLGELKSIMSSFDGVKAFSFNDDTFTMNQPHMKEFLTRYKDEIGIPFVCNTTVLDVDREMLEVMKEAGCDLVRFGVEAASRRIRRNVLKRDFSNKKTEEVFEICREIGLRSFTYNMLANPTETREEMVDTLRLNARLMPNGTRVSLGYPYEGTEYHEIAKALDVIDETKYLHDYLWDTVLKWSPEDKLWISKVRLLYWWWINMFLGNEASPLYAELVRMVEEMPAEQWNSPDTERDLVDLDEALSKILKRRKIGHYTIPFKERTDISILHVGRRTLEREVLDEH